MTLPLLLTVLAALHAPNANPDTFWVLAQKGADAQPIRGALIAEDATHYHVRVEGGELWLEKATVQRVEKDDLTVEAIQQKEQEKKQKDAAPAPVADTAEAAAKPAEAQAVEAAEAGGDPAKPAAQPAEPAPAASNEAQDPAAEAVIAEMVVRYDPVLHRINGGAAMQAAMRIDELRLAYQRTRSPELRKELRRARRGR